MCVYGRPKNKIVFLRHNFLCYSPTLFSSIVCQFCVRESHEKFRACLFLKFTMRLSDFCVAFFVDYGVCFYAHSFTYNFFSLPFFDNYFLGEHQHLRRVVGPDAPD